MSDPEWQPDVAAIERRIRASADGPGLDRLLKRLRTDTAGAIAFAVFWHADGEARAYGRFRAWRWKMRRWRNYPAASTGRSL